MWLCWMENAIWHKIFKRACTRHEHRDIDAHRSDAIHYFISSSFSVGFCVYFVSKPLNFISFAFLRSHSTESSNIHKCSRVYDANGMWCGIGASRVIQHLRSFTSCAARTQTIWEMSIVGYGISRVENIAERCCHSLLISFFLFFLHFEMIRRIFCPLRSYSSSRRRRRHRRCWAHTFGFLRVFFFGTEEKF